jgi:hypothetical protein
MRTNHQPTESDWKKFRSIVPVLRERYLQARNTELVAIFEGESLTPTEKFWAASERIEEIGGILRICLDDHRRSKMIHSLRLMYRHQMITDEEVNAFSEEIRMRIAL